MDKPEKCIYCKRDWRECKFDDWVNKTKKENVKLKRALRRLLKWYEMIPGHYLHDSLVDNDKRYAEKVLKENVD